MGSDIFRIIGMDGAGENNHVQIIGNIFCPLSIKYGNGFRFQHIRQSAVRPVRTGNPETRIRKNFCKTAHADTADTHKKDRNGVMKIYFIHNDPSFFLIFYH